MAKIESEVESPSPSANGVSLDHRLRGHIYRTALKLRAPGVLSKLAYLQTQQRLSWEEAAGSQAKRLKYLLLHAATRVPYYRNILHRSEIVSSSGEIRLDKFQRVPLLDKATLHSKFDELKSDDLNQRKWFTVSSGGSTGETTRVIQDQEFADWARAIGLFFDSWAGYLMGDRKLIIWAIFRDSRGRNSRLWRRLASIIRNEHRIDARSLTPGEMRDLLSRIEADKPKMLLAFPENMHELARVSLR